jgi:mannose-6-phosphate isomerase
VLQRATVEAHPKPWGSSDLRPWSTLDAAADPIGELWFQRPPLAAPALQAGDPSLLVKLLFTNQPLSIQVHPDDAYARSIGLPHGKSEAWYILSAGPGAAIALGLSEPLAPGALLSAVHDGSIVDRVRWRRVAAGDAWYVAPGTIHSLGAGVVLLEVQQRSDATFRLYDFGRHREMHADNALAAANANQEAHQAPRSRLDGERTVLVASPHFVLELVELQPDTTWELNTMTETWLFALGGNAAIGPLEAGIGDAFCIDADRSVIDVRSEPWQCLLAYVGSEPASDLLRPIPRPTLLSRQLHAQAPA